MRIYTLLLLCLALKIPGLAFAQSEDSPPLPEAVKQVFAQRTEVYFQFSPQGYASDYLTRIVSLDHYDENSGMFRAYANQAEFEQFLKLGLSWQLLNPPGYSLEKNSLVMLDQVDIEQIASWNFYPTYGAYEHMMQQYADAFPHLCNLVSLTTLDSGRQILFLKLAGNHTQPKPRVMLTSTMHGDETTGFNLLLRLIHYLLFQYQSDSRVQALLDGMEIWICPNENPDGTYTNDNQTVWGATRSNAKGIDLNRNYPNPAGTPSGSLQAETLAMMRLADSLDFTLSTNIHGGIECVNYPWDSWTSTQRKHADHHWWLLIAHEYADTARYYSPKGYMDPWGPSFIRGVTHGGDWYVVYGSRQDYMIYYGSGRELTLELSNTKLLPTAMLSDHWEYNKRSLLNLLMHAGFGLQGVVTDKISGTPLKAKIELIGHDRDNSHVFSRAGNGAFFRPLRQGSYSLRVEAEGYWPLLPDPITINDYQTMFLHLELSPVLANTRYKDHDRAILFPNPTTGMLAVRTHEAIIKMEFFNTHGTLAMVLYNLDPEAMDISMLTPGMYLVRIHQQSGVFTAKLLVRPS